MVMHKVDSKMEAGAAPDPKIVSGMGALVQESVKSGVFLSGAGLHRSAKRSRLIGAANEYQTTLGPYLGDNELLASFAMIKTESMADAVRHARRFAAASATAELEVGPVVEPWDIGLVPKPSGPVPQRFLLLSKADAAFEAGVAPKANAEAALQELSQALAPDGGVLAAGRLAPSAKGARSSAGGAGKRVWTDGPFAESKELIAGFSIIEVPSIREAIAWADRYAAVLGGNQVDVRELAS